MIWLAGLLGSKMTKYVIGAVVVGLAAFAIYSYVNVTQNKIEKLSKENAELHVQVSQYELAVKQLQDNFVKYRAALDDMFDSMVAAGIPEEKIIEFFKKNDFSKMTPEQLQSLINAQQIDIKRCLEVLSGKPRGKEPNPLCPDF